MRVLLSAIVIASVLQVGCYAVHERAVDAGPLPDAGPRPDAPVCQAIACPLPGAQTAHVPGTSPHRLVRIETPSWGDTAERGMLFVGPLPTYRFDDGTTVEGTPGTRNAIQAFLRVRRVERIGTTIRYHLGIDEGARWWSVEELAAAPEQVSLELDQPCEVVLEAEENATTATLDTRAQLVLDQPGTVDGPHFHYTAAPLCAWAHVVVHYTLADGRVWDEHTFERPTFTFRGETTIDFTP